MYPVLKIIRMLNFLDTFSMGVTLTQLDLLDLSSSRSQIRCKQQKMILLNPTMP